MRGGSALETQVSGLHGQPQRQEALSSRQVPRQAERSGTGTDPSYTRQPHGSDRGGAERKPAWLESVFRHCRSTEPSARHRQVDTTQVTLLHLETMGTSRLPGTAQARGKRARSVEYQQICIGGIKTTSITNTFSDVGQGEITAYKGSFGYLELAVRNGNLSTLLSIKIGDKIIIKVLSRNLTNQQN